MENWRLGVFSYLTFPFAMQHKKVLSQAREKTFENDIAPHETDINEQQKSTVQVDYLQWIFISCKINLLRTALGNQWMFCSACSNNIEVFI